MNETVARIVELLFQDVEMNDEVRAIRDEVMDNCQERFGDLLNRGLSEDEAIAAVVESLKGMEEVLAGYPRRAEAEDNAAFSGTGARSAMLGGNGGHAAFSAQGLRKVSVNLQGEDVSFEPSPDAEVHVICNIGENGENRFRVATELTGGELRVTREKTGGSERIEKHVHFNGADIDFFAKDFSFDSLGDMLRKLMRGIQTSFDGDERVCIQVPAATVLEMVQVQTTSGNVSVDGLMMDHIHVDSRSGDLRVELPDSCVLDWAELHTTSGDAEAWLSANAVVLQSMSGDVRYVGAAKTLSASSTSGDVTVELTSGSCGKCEVKSISGDVECMGAIQAIKANTTSGDITLNTDSETMEFATVSGDVKIMAQDSGLRSVEGHTTSGDVMVSLPGSVKEADVSLRSTSGDIRQGLASVFGAPVRIAVRTVSGDITVR